jgi:hypothetical protein
MDDLQKFIQRNLRRILATGALIFSLLALSLLLNSTPGGSFWIASAAIPAGAKISSSDVKLVKASLSENESHYFKGSEGVVGRIAARRLESGDLIAKSDLAVSTNANATTFLPVGVGVDDLPVDLLVGDLVDIYVIPKDSSTLPAVVARRVAVANIDQKSRALGGSVAVVLATNTSIAAVIVTAESQGRLVVARDSF